MFSRKFLSTKFVFTFISLIISFIALWCNKINSDNFMYITLGLAAVYQSSRAVTDIFQQRTFDNGYYSEKNDI